MKFAANLNLKPHPVCLFHHVFAVQKDEFPEAKRCQACLFRRTLAHLSRALVIRDKFDRQNLLVCGQHMQ